MDADGAARRHGRETRTVCARVSAAVVAVTATAAVEEEGVGVEAPPEAPGRNFWREEEEENCCLRPSVGVREEGAEGKNRAAFFSRSPLVGWVRLLRCATQPEPRHRSKRPPNCFYCAKRRGTLTTRGDSSEPVGPR